MVERPNNYNIAITCDICGRPVHFGEPYWKLDDGRQMCGDCYYKLIKYCLTGEI